jgi:hypothetical protein
MCVTHSGIVRCLLFVQFNDVAVVEDDDDDDDEIDWGREDVTILSADKICTVDVGVDEVVLFCIFIELLLSALDGLDDPTICTSDVVPSSTPRKNAIGSRSVK